MTHFNDMQIHTKADFDQARMEFDQYRSNYVASVESFIGSNAGRIASVKWEVESITQTADSYTVATVELVRDDGQSMQISSQPALESREIEWDSYSDGGEIANIVSKLQYNGVDDDDLVEEAFAVWSGIRPLIGLSFAEAVFEWVRSQPDLGAKDSIEISEMQVS